MIDFQYKISVCIPTFNRNLYLSRLYESIINQGFNDVELVIVDDGSTDETPELISSWKKNNRVAIQNFYQENAGRPTALRKALIEATGEFTVIMDDDDLFVPNAFELIKSNLDDLSKNKYQVREIAGICGLCLDEEGNVIGDSFPQDRLVTSYYDLRLNKRISGDKKEILRTDILQQNIYDTFNNEKRVPTSTLWYSISQDYNMIFVNDVFAVKNYLSGGMTDKNYSLRISSPNSHIQHALSVINTVYNSSLISTVKYSIFLWKYCFFGGDIPWDRIIKSKLVIVYLMLPFGFSLYCIERLR